MSEQIQSFSEDEIDLREIALTLWKGRWLILALTLAAAAIAYAVSAWALPKRYTATAYMAVGKPSVLYLTGNEGLSAAPNTPDIKALPELVKAKFILDQVADDPRVAPLLESNGKDLATMTQVSAVGASQLRLEVTDTDAEGAAILATVWAEKAAGWIELNYGLGDLVANLDAQVDQAHKNYAQAQSTLEIFMAQDQGPILNAQLDIATDVNRCLERRIYASNALLLRLADFRARLIQSDEPLSLSDALLLASLQQDIDLLEICGGTGAILQSSSPMIFTGLSSSGGLEIVSGFRQNLQQGIEDAQTEQKALQEEMPRLRVELAQLEYQISDYRRQRDQAESLFRQLTLQQTYWQNVLQQSGRVAYVSADAIVPQSASSPKPLLNAVVAGMIGLVVAALGALAVEWWKKVGTSA